VTDILSTIERSERMRSVRQAGTRPELALRHGLHAAGLRYRLHAAELPGRPDIVFPRFGVALFVHGCFWHGHSCAAGRSPATRRDYWVPKVEANKARDKRKVRALRRLGWSVFTVWECRLDTEAKLRATVAAVDRRVRSARQR
jgi:DNA mismatch endonuclease (patch repair protein)